MRILVGLPYASDGRLLEAAQAAGVPALISAGSLHRRRRRPLPDGSRPWGFTRIGPAAWRLLRGCALDSAGFVAMRQGGYRWTVAEYVEWVATCAGDGSRPFPWLWWSAMDYCCEPEIAGNRLAVERRIAQTVASYAEHLEALDWWHDEGVEDVPDPMPVLQGREPGDYVACAQWLGAVRARAGRQELPGLVGVGSVCRRPLDGPEGLLDVVAALDAALPAHVRLHLFGVKGAACPELATRFPHRVESVDSMAWDFRARRDALEQGISSSVEHRAAHLRHWVARQREAVRLSLPRYDADGQAVLPCS